MRDPRPRGSTRALATAIVTLVATMALAGCFGGDEPPTNGGGGTETGSSGTETGGAGGSPGTGTGTGTGTGGEGNLEEEEPAPRENVPEAHYHHYWGSPALSEVIIFDGTVTLTTDSCLDSESEASQAPCIGPEPHIGSVQFDLEDDGDNVGPDTREPHIDGHADTVFTGTNAITAEFDWDTSQLGNALQLFYKPANAPTYFPLQGDGIPVVSEDPRVTIPLSQGMADSAHQFRVSRWSFILTAASGPAESWPGYVYIGTGDVQVFMSAINGGTESIDPPHPDYWDGRDIIPFDEVSGSFTITEAQIENDPVSQRPVVRSDDHEDIQLPARAIVPAGTLKLVVTATVTPSDSTSEHADWGLKWHGANTDQYQVADAVEDGEGGSRIYTIPIDGFLVDPPYVSESYFRFGFYPVTQGQDAVGNYEADYTLSFEIHKDPNFTYFF